MDFSELNHMQPLDGDSWQSLSSLNYEEELTKINAEMAEAQDEIDFIPTDSIPFDKTDWITIFGAAMVEIAMDFLFSDPANPNSFASKCNSSDNPIGKWCNNIHKKIDHSGNPLDFQGQFDQYGNIIKNGVKHEGPTISYGGGDHRGLTDGHDLLRMFDAIRQYHDGVFRDSGFVNGIKVAVESSVNQYGNPYAKLSWLNAAGKYISHMFADFFSSKSLPIPGHSLLAKASDRDLRKFAADMYSDGVNLRTEFLQSITVLIPETFVRIVWYFRYKDSEFSKEAKKKKLHLMLLLTHGISTLVNIGKVIITENPASINIPMIFRVIMLAWRCFKEQRDFNGRLILKENWEQYKVQLLCYKTMIIVAEGVYETSNYQRLYQKLKEDYDKKVQERFNRALEITNLRVEYELQNEERYALMKSSDKEILMLTGKVDDNITSTSLSQLVKYSHISDNDIANYSINELLNDNYNE